jgi:hypothetical protein
MKGTLDGVANRERHVPDGQVTLQRSADRLVGGSESKPHYPHSKCTRSKEVSTTQVERTDLPDLSPTVDISKMPNNGAPAVSSLEVDPTRPEASDQKARAKGDQGDGRVTAGDGLILKSFGCHSDLCRRSSNHCHHLELDSNLHWGWAAHTMIFHFCDVRGKKGLNIVHPHQIGHQFSPSVHSVLRPKHFHCCFFAKVSSDKTSI